MSGELHNEELGLPIPTVPFMCIEMRNNVTFEITQEYKKKSLLKSTSGTNEKKGKENLLFTSSQIRTKYPQDTIESNHQLTPTDSNQRRFEQEREKFHHATRIELKTFPNKRSFIAPQESNQRPSNRKSFRTKKQNGGEAVPKFRRLPILQIQTRRKTSVATRFRRALPRSSILHKRREEGKIN